MSRYLEFENLVRILDMKLQPPEYTNGKVIYNILIRKRFREQRVVSSILDLYQSYFGGSMSAQDTWLGLKEKGIDSARAVVSQALGELVQAGLLSAEELSIGPQYYMPQDVKDALKNQKLRQLCDPDYLRRLHILA